MAVLISAGCLILGCTGVFCGIYGKNFYYENGEPAPASFARPLFIGVGLILASVGAYKLTEHFLT